MQDKKCSASIKKYGDNKFFIHFYLFDLFQIHTFAPYNLIYMRKAVYLLPREPSFFPSVHDFPASTYSNLNTDNARDTVFTTHSKKLPIGWLEQ